MVLNVFQEKRGGRAESDRAVRASVMGRVEGVGWGGLWLCLTSSRLQPDQLMSPGACGAHGTIVAFNTMRAYKE